MKLCHRVRCAFPHHFPARMYLGNYIWWLKLLAGAIDDRHFKSCVIIHGSNLRQFADAICRSWNPMYGVVYAAASDKTLRADGLQQSNWAVDALRPNGSGL